MAVIAELKIEGQHDVTLETGEMGFYVRYGQELTAHLDIVHARKEFAACCNHAKFCAGWFEDED